MLKTEDRAFLERLAESIKAADRVSAQLLADRDAAIRLAIESGGQPTEVGRIFGLSRERIRQIVQAAS